jgi:hypothetical protein
MNLNAWNRLSEEDRNIVRQEARKVEDAFFKEVVRMWGEEEKALLAKGMTVTQMGDAQKAKLAAAWSDGIWATAIAPEKTVRRSRSCANLRAARTSRVDAAAAASSAEGKCRPRTSIQVCAAAWSSSPAAGKD